MDAFSLVNLTALAADPVIWVALATLIAMEVVLGIDNLIFISIVTNKLPEGQRAQARRIGIGLALILRLALLGTVAFIVKLTTPVITLLGHGFSWRDIILIAGGLFLVWKATKEIHHHVDPAHAPDMFDGRAATATFASVIGQILILDMVFSVDSILAAVALTREFWIIATAIVVSVIAMLFSMDALSRFMERNPTVVMLALAFLVMIGMVLVAEGLGFHVPKGFVYVAMAFAAGVEGLNLLAKRAAKRKRLNQPAAASSPSTAPPKTARP